MKLYYIVAIIHLHALNYQFNLESASIKALKSQKIKNTEGDVLSITCSVMLTISIAVCGGLAIVIIY